LLGVLRDRLAVAGRSRMPGARCGGGPVTGQPARSDCAVRGSRTVSATWLHFGWSRPPPPSPASSWARITRLWQAKGPDSPVLPHV